MPRIERRNQQRPLPPSWGATAYCLGVSATERFGAFEPLASEDESVWLWLEGEPDETLLLWELVLRAMMAHERGVPMERLVGRRPPWEGALAGTVWCVTVGETEGVATASCAFLSAVEDSPWAWHAVGAWGLVWPALRMLTDGLVELGAHVFAERDAAMEFSSTGPSVAVVGGGCAGGRVSAVEAAVAPLGAEPPLTPSAAPVLAPLPVPLPAHGAPLRSMALAVGSPEVGESVGRTATPVGSGR